MEREEESVSKVSGNSQEATYRDSDSSISLEAHKLAQGPSLESGLKQPSPGEEEKETRPQRNNCRETQEEAQQKESDSRRTERAVFWWTTGLQASRGLPLPAYVGLLFVFHTQGNKTKRRYTERRMREKLLATHGKQGKKKQYDEREKKSAM